MTTTMATGDNNDNNEDGTATTPTPTTMANGNVATGDNDGYVSYYKGRLSPYFYL